MIVGTRVLFGIIGSLAIINNSLLLVVIFRNRTLLKTPYNRLVSSLAIIDLITGIGIFVTPSYIIRTDSITAPSGNFGQIFCRVIYSQYLVFTMGIVSVYTVACMAMDRWLAVARPTKYKTILTKPRVNICVLCIWMLSVLLNTPHLMEMTVTTGSDSKEQCSWIVLTEGTTRRVVAILEFVGKFFLPLLAAAVTMVSIYNHIKSSPALFQTNRGKAGLRLLRMCMLTAVILGVCWFPNQLYYLLFKYDITQLDTPLHHFTVVMCMFNSCVNPLIYCISNRMYRRYFSLLLCPWHRARVTEMEMTASDRVSGVNGFRPTQTIEPLQHA
ncbi:allatostatin-A receptor-like [Stylophora pistillata]|uniref:allatostatin-A receptor-like n=1 Tax=Stylophora pistillata TaxID=50429 RepID=UPI000C047A9D|nr:allatostatin-A receptor-like [Stylophora pistillata]